MAVQPRQHQPLGARDAERAHAAIEGGAQQARDVGITTPMNRRYWACGNCSGAN